jgi:hypothetical protein
MDDDRSWIRIGARWGDLHRLPNSRTCAGCDLCCTVAGVHVAALEKAPGVRCTHLTALTPAGRNCMIYARRPGACAGFQCLWRCSETTFSAEYFPPDCGFAIWINDAMKWPMTITVGCDPQRPTAWDRPRFRARFKALAYELNCIVAIGEGELCTHVFAPSGRVYSKAERPEFFIEGGRRVGVPSKDFRPGVQPTLAEVAQAILGIGRP